MQIKVFQGSSDHMKIENQVNKWLQKYANQVRIVEVQFGYGYGWHGAGYSAMILYEEQK